MGMGKFVVAAGLAVVLAGVGGCASPTPPVIAPVTREVGSLQGAEVQLMVGQALNIDTGDIPVDGYLAEVDDPAIAEFVPGREEGGAVYNPGLKALSAGSTTVMLSNPDAGVEDVVFTVEVTSRTPAG